MEQGGVWFLFPSPALPRKPYLDFREFLKIFYRRTALSRTTLLKSVFHFQALPRRRLARRRLVSGDGVHVSATFSRSERGPHCKVTNGDPCSACFSSVLKRRLVAAPLPLTQGALKQPNGGTRAPVTNDLVLTGGLAIPDILAPRTSTPCPHESTCMSLLVTST